MGKKSIGKTVEVNGRLFRSIKSAARLYGVPDTRVRDRIARGWTIEQALELTPKPQRSSTKAKRIAVDGKPFPSLAAAADHFGINRIAFRARMYAGWSPEEAAEFTGRAKYQRASLPEAERAAEERGGILLSKNVATTKDRLKWRCGCGHNFVMSLGDVRRGLWCGRCRSTIGSRGERVTRAYFEALFGSEFPSTWPKWLDGLELDGFNPSLSLAFEHQGKQHYAPVASRGGKRALRGIRNRDRKKAGLCKKNGVRLVIVPEIGTLLPLSDLRKLIIDKCARLGCPVPRERQHLEVGLKDAYTTNQEIEKLEEVRAAASELGVEILADAYFRSNYPMPARCNSCGHEWNTSAERIILNRAGCQRCARKLVGEKNQKPVTVAGRDFASVSAALKHFGTTKDTYENRRRRGCSADACFGAVPPFLAEIADGFSAGGDRFSSVADACRNFGVNEATYESRRNLGFSFEVCCGAEPTPKARQAKSVDVDGERFDSIGEACRHFGADRAVFLSRRKQRHSLKVCLQIEPLPPHRPVGPRKPLTVAGKTFPSVTAACVHHGVSRHVYKQRRRLGHSVEVSMGIKPLPPRRLNRLAKPVAVAGKRFPSVAAACAHFGVNKVTFYRRIKRGHSIEQALAAKS